MHFKQRSLVAMALLMFFTFGFYMLYWLAVTKGELNTHGADLPTAWLLIIPIGNIYFFYKFAQAFSRVVLKKKDDHTLEYFLLLTFLLPIAELICQNKMNEF